MSLSLFNYAISSSFSASAGNIYTSTIVSITGVTSGSITFTPAFPSFNNYASASLLWLSGSTGPGPFYNISGGYITSIDPQAFSSSFNFSNSTTLVTQSNSSFYFDSSSIVGYPNSQFQITYLTGSSQANQTLVVDRVVDFYIDTGSGENAISFKNLIYNPSTENYDFQTYTSIKGGIETTARGTGSFAVGTSSLAQGNASVAEGIGTLATGLASHAAGINTTASGVAAFSMGIETDADGTASFAAGSGSWARGTATVAFGIGTIASSSGQLVVGHYNETKSDINNIFVVGDGTGPLSVNRRNIIEVYGGQGAGLRGVKIDTAATPTISPTIDGFNVYGQTYLRGNTDIFANKITSIGDTTLGLSGSIIFEAYNSLPALVGRTVMDWKGINFDDAFGGTSPGSTYLWRNSGINHLYYGSSQLIQDGGNNTGAVAQPLIIGTANASNLELETNNTTRIFISSSGNVGIGTLTPTLATLQIQGNVSASSYTGSFFGTSSWAINALTASFVNTASTNAFVQNGNLFGATALLGTNDNQNLQFETSGSVRMTISSSGNIGIGTETPQRRLHIDASGSANTSTPLLLTSVDSNNRVGILFASSSLSAGRQHNLFNRVNTPTVEWLLGTNAGETALWNFIPRDDTNYAITLRTPYNGGTAQITTGLSQSLFSLGAGGAANQHLNISSSGNVGIGTTTPLSLLHVSASSGNEFLRITSGSQNILNIRSGSAVFFAGTGVAPTANFDLDVQGTGTANGGSVRFAGNSTIWNFASTSTVSRTSTGNTSMFDVSMTGTSATVIQNPMSVTFNATQNPTSGSGYIVLRLNATHATTAGTGSKLLQSWEFGGTRLSVMDLSGSLGIGTGSAPPARLFISGASNQALFEIDSPAVNNIIYVSGSGRVGIGTATPIAQLHVTNSMLVNGTSDYFGGIGTTVPIQMFAGVANNGIGFRTDNFYLYPYGNNTSLIYGWNGNAAWTLRNLNTSSFQIFNNSPTNAVMWTVSSSGDMGIGTTTPTSKLHVSGASNAGLLEIDSPAVNNILFVSGSGNVGIGTNLPSADLHISGASADSLLRVGSPTQANILFITGSNRVGIGTSTPSALFEVNDKIIAEAGANVGIQTVPTDWIHLSSDPASSKYLNIDATQTSNGPQQTPVPGTFNYVAGPGTDDAVLGLPNYWMEIKLDGNIVLVPCYVPQ